MKFIKGLIIGSILGFAMGSALSEQQRKQLTSSLKKTTAPIGESIKGGVGQVADNVVEQAADKIDVVGERAANAVAAD